MSKGMKIALWIVVVLVVLYFFGAFDGLIAKSKANNTPVQPAE